MTRAAKHARRRGLLPALAIAAFIVLVAGGIALAVRETNEPANGGDARAGVGGPVSPGLTPSGGGASPTPPPVPGPIPGYLLIADRGNDRMLLVDGDKRVLWAYPSAARPPSFPFHYDDDAFFADGFRRIISQQEDQQTIQVISFPEGRVVWTYGHVNVSGSARGFLSTPDDAYLLPDGTRTVADVKNCRVLFISPSKRVVRQLGTTGACGHDPPRLLSAPNGDTPMPNGATLVTEINGSWIDAISETGKLMWSVQAPVGYPSDAQYLGDGKILLADYSSPGHVLIMTTRGKVLWRYGPSSGPGALDHPSLALMLPNRLIAVNEDFRNRVVLISQSKHRIVWQYGHTDSKGTKHGYLHIPDGMDFLPFEAAMADPAIRAVVTRNGELG
jgi:hypothetical protein